MSLFDDVIVNTAAAVDAVSKKATEIVDKSRVRVSSAELKRRISAQFETLGRYVYDTTVAGTTDSEVVNQYTREISELIKELKSLQDSLAASSGKIICPSCECENPCDSLFCRRCGSSLDFAKAYTVNKPGVAVPEPVVTQPISTENVVSDLKKEAPCAECEEPTEPEVEIEIFVDEEQKLDNTDGEV